MRSPGNGVCQLQCESVKVLSPEIIHSALGQGFHILEASTGMCELVSAEPACRGLSPWRANELFMLELGRTDAYQTEAIEERKKRRGGMAQSVVGLTHSRGVGRVIPVESRCIGTLEGVSGIAQRDEVGYAAP